MKKYMFFCLFVCGLACSEGTYQMPESSLEMISNEKSLVFKSDKEVLQNEKLGLKTGLFADLEKTQMVLKVMLYNPTKETQFLNVLAEIAIPEGIKSPALNNFTNLSLPSKQQQVLSFVFEPVNHLRLYRQIGEKGDFKPSYQIALTVNDTNNVAIINENIGFQTLPDEYNQYLKTFGKEPKINILELKNDYQTLSNDLKNHFVSQVIKAKSADVSKDQSAAVIINDEELNIGGVVLRLSFYQVGDTLYNNIRLSNRSTFVLKIQPEAFQIKMNGKIYQPSNNRLSDLQTNRKDEQRGIAYVLKSERLEHIFKYSIANVNDLNADFGGILIENTKLLNQSLTFSSSTY